MAQSDLIILTFTEREEAGWARRALEMMREQHGFGLEYALEITRDRGGKTHLHQRIELPAYPYPPDRRLPTLLSAVIFSASGEDHVRRLANTGLDEFFLRRVTQALVPNSSALLMFVPEDDALVDLRALLDALSRLKGTLHRTSVPEGIEQSLIYHVRIS